MNQLFTSGALIRFWRQFRSWIGTRRFRRSWKICRWRWCLYIENTQDPQFESSWTM